MGKINLIALNETNIFRKALSLNKEIFSAVCNIKDNLNYLKVKNDFLELICRSEFNNVYILDSTNAGQIHGCLQDSLIIVNMNKFDMKIITKYQRLTAIYNQLLQYNTKANFSFIVITDTFIPKLSDVDLFFVEYNAEIDATKGNPNTYVLKEGKLHE